MAKDNKKDYKPGKKATAGKFHAKDYSHFQAEDLLADESFQDWVLHPESSPEAAKFWTSAISANNALADQIAIARDLISGIRFKEEFPSDSVVKASLKRNLERIEVAESDARPGRGINTVSIEPKRPRQIKLFYRAAILVGLLLGAYLIYYMQMNARVRIETSYGQTKNIMLPDSSEVILNAHSVISYPKHWAKGKPRSLVLEGEAYFKIRHLNQDPERIQPGERFIIHSGSVKVEVLGTQFDVNARGDSTSIVLEKGSIQVQAKSSKEKLLLQPGERVVYSQSSQAFSTTRVQASDYISWTRHELLLKGENLRQIGQMLNDYYGVQIVLKSSDIENRKMEGTLLLDSLPDVLFALSTAMDLTIMQRGDTLIMEKRK